MSVPQRIASLALPIVILLASCKSVREGQQIRLDESLSGRTKTGESCEIGTLVKIFEVEPPPEDPLFQEDRENNTVVVVGNPEETCFATMSEKSLNDLK